MAKYFLSNKAVEDLSTIWEYTFEVWSESQADKYYKYLIDSCQGIAFQPAIGKIYPEVSVNLFGCRANRHIIFYRKTSDGEVEIIRILHGRMDLKSKLEE